MNTTGQRFGLFTESIKKHLPAIFGAIRHRGRHALLTGMLAVGFFPQTVTAAGTVGLYPACINGLQVDINGGAAPGASVTSIVWTWGDGQQTIGFFPQSHTNSSSGQFLVTVTANYNDGTTASASQTVGVAPGVLSNCLSLTLTAGQGGAISYQASIGSGTVQSGASATLELDFTDDLLLTAEPAAGLSFSGWSASPGITFINGNPTATSIDVFISANSTLTGHFGPFITSVGTIPNLQNPRIAIEGDGFGVLPSTYVTPFTGNTPYFRFRDVTRGWEAGYQASGALVGDACTVTIYDWEASKLAVGVNAGSILCPNLNISPGDNIEIDVCSPSLSSCVPGSTTTGSAQASQTVTQQLTFRLFIPPNLHAQSINGISVGIMPQNLNLITNGIVQSLAGQGITITGQDIGYAMVDSSTVPTHAIAELNFLISAPTFFSEVIDTAHNVPELLPLVFVQQFGVPCLPRPFPQVPCYTPITPVDIVADVVAATADAEATLKSVTAQWCATQNLGVPEYLIMRDIGIDQELQVTISNLSKMPTALQVPVSYYVVMLGGCNEDTSGALKVKSPAGTSVTLVPAF